MTPAVALTIAGTDSGGAAGVAADLATFAALGVHGACAVTAITAQDTTGVHAVHPVPIEVVEAQVDAVLGDLPVAAVKTGMLGSVTAVELVVERLAAIPGRALVVDPVLVATSGAVLGDAAVATAYREILLPVATVVTPNHDEARALVGRDGAPEELAAELAGRGCTVILTGGPEWRPGERAGMCTDWLASPEGQVVGHVHPAVPTTNDHGSGCTFSAALAALLARGASVADAGAAAADFTRSQLELGASWQLGRGRGPVAHVPALSTRPDDPGLVPQAGVEPATFRLGGGCSIR